MDAFTTTALGAAGLAGLAGSIHCSAMCGPLACAALPTERSHRAKAAVAWHAGRTLGYTAAGAALGSMGAAVLSQAPVLTQAAPWLVVGGLLLTATDVTKRLPALPGFREVFSRAAKAGAHFSPPARAGVMGALTPLLPCGLIYGAFLSAAGMGTAWGGAALMAAFSLGAVPALALTQGVAGRLGHLGTHTQAWRRGLMVVAALVVAYRAVNAGAPATAEAAATPPHCH